MPLPLNLQNPLTIQDQPLKQTQSLCPVCLQRIDATVIQRGQKVVLQKHCNEHGRFEATIASDRRFYHLSLGADSGEGCGPSCNCSPVTSNANTKSENQSDNPADRTATCIALMEIVDDCNLTCPTCYAGSSPPLPGHAIQALDLAEHHARIDAVIARKGSIDVLQLSGGEPTIHPNFFELLESTLKRPDVLYVLLNTNGLLIANRPGFAERLGELRQQHGKFELYLQFDGPQAAGQTELRGQDLRDTRLRVIDRCTKHQIPLGLAMTIDQHNLAHLGDTLQLALAHPIVRGISFQPMFGSGRAYPGVNTPVQLTTPAPGNKSTAIDSHTNSHPIQRPPTERLSVADIVLNLVDQAAGLVGLQDFTPLPCGDPNCHTVGYLVRTPNSDQPAVGVNQFVDFQTMQGFLKDRVNYNLEDLMQCGCESTDLGRTLKALEIGPESVLRLFIKPFMDAWTYDQHRIDRCCVHVVGQNGQLTSFCQHYAAPGPGPRK